VEIEGAMLAGQHLAKIAKFYNLNYAELKNHRDTCARYVLSLDEFDQMVLQELQKSNYGTSSAGESLQLPGSIQRNLKLREGDILAATAQEYMVTLKNLGRKINKFIDNADTPDGMSAQQRFLRKPVMDAYVMIGGEIRQTIKTMADIDRMLNAAEPESPVSGLNALANAIASSVKPGE